MKRSTIALFIAILASLLFVGQALAHALLLRSIPESNAELSQPPATLDLWFSEPLEEGFSAVLLLNTAGDEVPLTPQVDKGDQTHLSAALPALAPGIYTVSWTTLSQADGHAWSGSFPFTVLNPDGSRPTGAASALNEKERSELPTPLQTTARWLMLTGSILLMGMALFFGYVAAETMQTDPELKTRLDVLTVRLLALAVLAVVLGSWLQLIVQAIQLDGLAQLPRLVTSTYGGILNLTRQIFSVAGLLNFLWLSPQPLPTWQRWIILRVTAAYAMAIVALIVLAAFHGQSLIAVSALILLGALTMLPQRLTLLIAGAAVLVGFSISSHAGAVTGSFWAITFDIVHLLGTSAWAGGIILLPLFMQQHRQTAVGENPSGLRSLFRRYGQMAKLSFFVLWATGLLSSLVQVPNIESLLTTPYGQVLLIKITLMFGVWGLSMASSRVFRGKPDPAQISALMKKFTRLVNAAALSMLALMLVVAVLVQTQPPPKPDPLENAPDYHTYVTADDLTIHLQVSPGRIGQNEFYAQLYHADGSSIGDVQLVRLMFDEQNTQLGQSKVEMQPLGPTRYWVDGPFLNRPGNWKISIYVRRYGMDDLMTALGKITLTAPPTQKESLFHNPVTTIPPGWLFAGIFILIGLEVSRWRKTFQQSHPQSLKIFQTISIVLIVLGLLVAGVSFLVSG